MKKTLLIILFFVNILFSKNIYKEIECNKENLEKFKKEFYLSIEKEKYLRDLKLKRETEQMRNYSILIGLIYGDCKNHLENQ